MENHDENHPHPPYKAIFFLLCIFTGISWAADELRDFIPGHAILVAIVLIVATAKALCVMLFFMHLKFERRWKFVILAPTIILAIGLPLSLIPDIGLNYYEVDVPQQPLVDAPDVATEVTKKH
jgi:cytochrome c oxidase subunit 4